MTPDDARQIIQAQIDALHTMQHKLTDTKLNQLINLCQSCSGKLILCGIGKSGYIARKIVASLISVGIDSLFLHPSEGLHGDIGNIQEKDCVLMISNSGETQELQQLQHILHQRNVKTFVFTRNLQSTLAQQATLAVYAGSYEEIDEHNLLPTCSTTCALVMGDLIVLALAMHQNWQPHVFAQHHPSGNLGTHALIPLHKMTQSAPIVSEHCPLTETLTQLLQGHCGLVLITNLKQKLQGLITEGDLSRFIQQHPDSWGHYTAQDIMMSTPQTLTMTHTVNDAEQLMREHSINAVILINDDHTPLGVYSRLYRKSK